MPSDEQATKEPEDGRQSPSNTGKSAVSAGDLNLNPNPNPNLPAWNSKSKSNSNSTSPSKSTKSGATRPPKGHHGSRRRHQSSSKRPSSDSTNSQRECVCGRGVACFGMTQAFRMLQDPRCYFVELPRHRPDPPAFKYVFRNNLRKAYLREMVRQHPTNETLRAELENPATNVPKQRKYVALHHFHPTVIRAFYENPLTLAQKHKVPISITEHELGELGTECRDEDRILSISGTPTGGYYFTPSYPHEKACKDLKVLIQAVRNRTHKKSPTRSKRRSSDPNVPTDIEITTTTRERDSANDSKANVDKEKNKKEGEGENENESENDKKERAQGKSVFKNRAVENDVHVRSGVLESGNDDSEEFDKIWDKSSRREIESSVLNETIIEEEEDAIAEENADETKEQPETDARSAQHKRESLLSRRSTDRPWATPKYRRDREKTVRRVSAAADYIDPNNIGELNDKLASTTGIVDDGEDIARIAADMTVLAQDKSALVSPVSTPASPSRDVKESPSVRFSPLRTPYSPIRRPTSDDDTMSLGSTDSALKNYTMLDHQLPGADPTLRIQVHNDLIAWESKRRSDLAQQLEYNRERWMAASDVLTDGIAEAKYAERLILGISKASRLFADSLRAVYDDKLLDDKGNAVKSSFIRNRLAKQRNGVEYSIDNEDSKQGSGLGSALLDSIVSAQLDIADAFVENSDHTEQEILPEITELRNEIENNAQRLQAIGEAVISELKQSEIEVKNIWDVFDAMVTGDLMEYTTHGSSHGGSSHGGSLHSSSMNTGGSGSIHGFLTPRDENEALIVSSASSPLMKSSFHQLGRVEDGWLVEMYYKSAVAFQRSVFGAAEMEFCNLFQEISTLEELRFRKLHQFMLAFAPRQRRLFNKLPEQLKNVLENLVGLRIDEDSLQKVLDESVKDRSKDHLKGSTAHKSSILNRSKINARVENVENDIEDMEKTYGSPFASPMILLSKMVELKATGLKSLVNTAWKPSLCVVTSDGNMLVFGTPDKANTPPEAFKSLYPRMNFDDPDTWVTGRKVDMVKSLTPMVCIRLTKSTLALSQLRKSQIEITEEVDTVAGSRFMNAVKSRAQQTKCTLRLPSNTDASDWVNLLQRMKKVLKSQSSSRRGAGLRH